MFNHKTSVALLALMCAACTPRAADWTPTETKHENKVERAIDVFRLSVSDNQTQLSSSDKKSFKDFLSIAAPSLASAKVTLKLSRESSSVLAAEVKKELRKYGFAESQIELLTLEKNINSQAIMDVIVERAIVTPPRCGEWTQKVGDAKQKFPTPDLGCSQVANLGMMIANPMDLVEGRPTGDYDGANQAMRVRYYRTDNVKALSSVTASELGSDDSGSSSSGAALSGGL